MHPFESSKTEHAACFTGHRPGGLPWAEDDTVMQSLLREALREKILEAVERGTRIFYTGMAEGVDLMAAGEVLKLREEGQPLRLFCVLPYRGQNLSFSPESQAIYEDILNRADDTVVLSQQYTKDCFHARNRYMVDHSASVIAVYNRARSGGTYYTVRYALKKGRAILLIDPESLGR